MPKHRSFGQKVNSFFHSIGLPPKQALIGLLVLGAVAAALFFANQKQGIVSSNESDIGIDKQINELELFDPSRKIYTEAYRGVQENNEKIAELRQRDDITPALVKKLNSMELRNLETLVLRSMKADVNADNEMEAFVNFAESLLNTDDQQVKDSTGFALVRTLVSAFVMSPTEARSITASEAIKFNQASFVNSKTRADLLRKLFVKGLDSHPANPYVDSCIREFGAILETSSSADIATLGRNIHEYTLYSKVHLESLEKRIRYREPKALGNLDQALRTLEANPDTDIRIWKTLIRSYEATLSIEAKQNFQTARNIIGELVAKLPDSDQRKAELRTLLDRQKMRSETMGTFDLSGTTFDGQPIGKTSNEFTALVFVDQNPKSTLIMKEISTAIAEGSGAFRPIMVFKRDFVEQDRKNFKLVPRRVLVASRETALKYLESFPCDHFPYLLLIDRNGVIVAGNLSVVQTGNRIATFSRNNKP